MVVHPIKPVYNEESRFLILGSFPSVKSREEKFFYAHSQNRFWKVLSAVLEVPVPETIAEKKELLLSSKIALWDVVYQCEIVGSSDSSIKQVVPSNLQEIFDCAHIEKIFLNGKTAEKYYNKYQCHLVDKDAICLPSTSSANAMYTLERLVDKWKIINTNLY
ncbi:MAG: DNA-deoxyinosine glycosylase [Acutalibacteraceae bacterium]|nr:DNA-deoxyinosine glycosylase [Acutalibacteraceae bacterium]